jgi:hypothetical protein
MLQTGLNCAILPTATQVNILDPIGFFLPQKTSINKKATVFMWALNFPRLSAYMGEWNPEDTTHQPTTNKPQLSPQLVYVNLSCLPRLKLEMVHKLLMQAGGKCSLVAA